MMILSYFYLPYLVLFPLLANRKNTVIFVAALCVGIIQ
jgi:hypothetical protein